MIKNVVNKFANSTSLSVQLTVFLLIFLLTGEFIEFSLELLFEKDLTIDFGDESLSYIFFEAVILAPIIETFLFQFLLLELTLLVLEETRHKYKISILISGFIFGVLHTYNLGYMIATTILGWMFAFVYIFYKKNKRIKPFIAVLLLHCIYNFIVLIKDYY